MFPQTINIDYLRLFGSHFGILGTFDSLICSVSIDFFIRFIKNYEILQMKLVFYHLKALVSSYLNYVQKSHFCFLQDVSAAILNGTFSVYIPDIARCSSWFCPHIIFRVT